MSLKGSRKDLIQEWHVLLHCRSHQREKALNGIFNDTSTLTCRRRNRSFDRSWYNRAGVERVMGFATEKEVEEFFRDVVEFERMLVRSGIILLKYWFSISDEEQQFRFQMRIEDPLKQWKLSSIDLESRVRWEQYTKAKEEMFERTSIDEAPWYIVEGNDKRRERLNCISHILSKVPFSETPHEDVELPERFFNKDYERQTMPKELYVPKRF